METFFNSIKRAMTAYMVNERLGGYGILKHAVKNDFDLAYLAANGVPKASAPAKPAYVPTVSG